jgi:hypothetical protein
MPLLSRLAKHLYTGTSVYHQYVSVMRYPIENSRVQYRILVPKSYISFADGCSFAAVCWFVLYAPNPPLCKLLDYKMSR